MWENEWRQKRMSHFQLMTENHTEDFLTLTQHHLRPHTKRPVTTRCMQCFNLSPILPFSLSVYIPPTLTPSFSLPYPLSLTSSLNPFPFLPLIYLLPLPPSLPPSLSLTLPPSLLLTYLLAPSLPLFHFLFFISVYLPLSLFPLLPPSPLLPGWLTVAAVMPGNSLSRPTLQFSLVLTWNLVVVLALHTVSQLTVGNRPLTQSPR